MKKNIIKVAFIAAFAIVAGYNVYNSQITDIKSDLALDNVEALAYGENPFCPNGCHDNGGGCYCRIWYPTYREHKW